MGALHDEHLIEGSATDARSSIGREVSIDMLEGDHTIQPEVQKADRSSPTRQSSRARRL